MVVQLLPAGQFARLAERLDDRVILLQIRGVRQSGLGGAGGGLRVRREETVQGIREGSGVTSEGRGVKGKVCATTQQRHVMRVEAELAVGLEHVRLFK